MNCGRKSKYLSNFLLFLIATILNVVILVGFVPPCLPALQANDERDASSNLSSFQLPDKGNPKLDSVLNQLVRKQESQSSDNYTTDNRSIITDNSTNRSMITANFISSEDPMVRVIIESQPGQVEAVTSAISGMANTEGTYGDMVQATVPVSELKNIAGLDAVKEARTPMVPLPDSITSEGVGIINAPDWQTASYNGAGVKIGILDVGFSGYTTRQSEGELPSNIMTWWASGIGGPGTDNHGTACAEIVYDIAPQAAYFFANFSTDVEYGLAVDWLIAQGVNVISSSVGWPIGGRGNGTGPICQIVDKAHAAGIFWAQSAGNQAQRHWQGAWNNPDGDYYLNLSGDDEGNTIHANAGDLISIGLKWDDPWSASSSDYDLMVFYDSTHGAISSNIQDGNDHPTEFVTYTAPFSGDYDVVIFTLGQPKSVNFHLYSYYQDFQYQTSLKSLCVPADASGAMTVGAVNYNTPALLELFSSHGPTDDGRTKPDIVAPDGVSTKTLGNTTFLGTSASVPHVVGAAALVMQRYPVYTVTQVQNFLEQKAVDLGNNGKDNAFGSGRLYLDYFTPRYVWDVIDTVSSPFGLSGRSSLVVDERGYPHMAYDTDGSIQGQLKYVKWDGANWQIVTIDDGGSTGDKFLALDSHGFPHICYGKSNNELVLANWDGISWHRETIATDVNTGYSSLVIDETDLIYMVYWSRNGDLKYVYQDGSIWHTEVVDTVTTGRCTLAIDSLNRPHIAYTASNSWLKYAYYDGNAWQFYSAGFQVSSLSMALDNSGNPYMSYLKMTDDSLGLAHFNGSSWQIQTIDNSAYVGEDCSITCDTSGYPHITYGDNNHGTLKYAYSDGSAWHTSIISDSSGWEGSSIALWQDNICCGLYGYVNPDTWQVKCFRNITPRLPLQNSLTIAVNGNGTVEPDAGIHTYDPGTIAPISATPATGYHFVNWTGDTGTIANVNSPNTTITMNGNYAITANFAADPPVNHPPILNPIGNKQVTAGQTLQFTISASDPDNDVLTYSASNLPAGAAFNASTHAFSWTPSAVSTYPGIRFTVSDSSLTDFEDITITVNAVQPLTYTLTISVVGQGMALKTPNADSYAAGTLVELDGVAIGGNHFVNWTGDTSTIENVNHDFTTITMNDNYSIMANFAPDPPIITSITPSTVSGNTGSQVTITGINFGATQGDGKVEFFWQNYEPPTSPYLTAPVISWSDTQIICIVPVASSGDTNHGVRVWTTAGYSNDSPITITFSAWTQKWGGDNPMGKKFYINLTGAPPGALQAIIDAAQTWNNVDNANFYFEFGSVVTDTCAENNGRCEIYWKQYSNPQTMVWSSFNIENSLYTECDMIFNTDWAWSTDGSTAYDVQGRATQQFGTWLGLAFLYGAHDTSKVMCVPQRTLAPEDMAGIQWKYPGTGTRGQYHIKLTNNTSNNLQIFFKSDINTDFGRSFYVPMGQTINSWCEAVPVGNHVVSIKWNDGTEHTLTSGALNVPVEGNTEYSFTLENAPTPANHPPVLDPIGNKQVTVGQTLQFTVSASDQDNDTLTYSASNLPTGAVFNTESHVFTWTPSTAGTFTGVHFTVSDGSLNDFEDITITVNALPPVNHPPALDPIGDKTVTANQLLQFTVTASDPDGDTLTYIASNLPSGVAFNTLTHTFNWTPAVTGTFPGIHFEVSDGKLADSEDITITVNASPLPSFILTINTIGQGTVTKLPNADSYTSGTSVQLTANASSGWSFSGWSGDLSGNTNPVPITINRNMTVTATFTKNTQTGGDGGGGGGGFVGGGGGFGGGGSAGSSGKMITSFGGLIDSNGKLIAQFDAESFDAKVKLEIPRFTIAKNRLGYPLTSVTILDVAEPDKPQEGSKIIGKVYDFSPKGATFSPSLKLIIKYNDDELPEGITEDMLSIALWDEATRTYIPIDFTIDKEANIIHAFISHFSRYTILAVPGSIEVTPPEPATTVATTTDNVTVNLATMPASFEVSSLIVSPTEVEPGQEVTISVTVSNKGQQSGTCEANLTLNGSLAESKGIALDGGKSTEVGFKLKADKAGKQIVQIDSLLGAFIVKGEVAIPQQVPLPAQTTLAPSTTSAPLEKTSPATTSPAPKATNNYWLIASLMIVIILVITGLILFIRRRS